MDHNQNSESNNENNREENFSAQTRACVNLERILIKIMVSLIIIVALTLGTVFIVIKKETKPTITTTSINTVTTTTKARMTTKTGETRATMTTTTIEVCKMGATAIIFDDILNKSPAQGDIPSIYNELSWTNGHYINATVLPKSGYVFIEGEGEYVAWFNSALTIQTLIANNTITLNSCLAIAGWSNSLFLTIDGYYNTTLLNTTQVPLSMSKPTVLILDWYGLNKIVFTPSGVGNYDIGIDNLCITF